MGSVSFLIADALGVSYWTVCAAAFLPVVVYYGILIFQIDSEAIRYGFRGLPVEKLPAVWSVLRRGWYYLAPLGVLIFTLGVLKYSAQTSILYTIIALVICSCFSARTRLTSKRILEILDDTAAGLVMVIPLCTGIGILVGALNISGMGGGLAGALADIAGNSRFLLLGMTPFEFAEDLTKSFASREVPISKRIGQLNHPKEAKGIQKTVRRPRK